MFADSGHGRNLAAHLSDQVVALRLRLLQYLRAGTTAEVRWSRGDSAGVAGCGRSGGGRTHMPSAIVAATLVMLAAVGVGRCVRGGFPKIEEGDHPEEANAYDAPILQLDVGADSCRHK